MPITIQSIHPWQGMLWNRGLGPRRILCDSNILNWHHIDL